MPSPSSILRRYKWDDLTEAEQEAVGDSLSLAATRAGVGVGFVLTTAAAISSMRQGKAPLPPLMRYGGVTFFTLVGAYAGLLSAGPTYARRILSVPNSRLADDLRTVAGDWQARVPQDQQGVDAEPHLPLPNPNKAGEGDLIPKIVRRGQES